MDDSRALALNSEPLRAGPKRPVLVWMHREHRVRDNFTLLLGQDLALRHQAPLVVAHCLTDSFLGATMRQYGFLLTGLAQVQQDLQTLNIPYFQLRGDPAPQIRDLSVKLDAGVLVADFDSLRIKRGWLERVAAVVGIRVLEVDSRNTVPCRVASPKREYAARTIRPKIHKLLPEYLHEPPRLVRHPHSLPNEAQGLAAAPDWDQLRLDLPLDRTVPENGLKAGEDEALAALKRFIKKRLPAYAARRNDPNAGATSGLSAYLHFGMISSLRVALEVIHSAHQADENSQAFLEELIVRRELADNFCFHAQDYDRISCFPDWAVKTLNKHYGDKRPYLYTGEELERSLTHDPLWNAAQKEMMLTGSMPGYLRMYWAKKILEWSPNPEQAVARAIQLNDRYLLDGRDANGYTGIAWSMGGVHDRPWKERPVFGTIRYMNLNGARRKFDVDGYVKRVAALG